jgi:hypothetical protein
VDGKDGVTAMQLAGELLDLERLLMQPVVRRSAERLRALICDDFLEYGASGQTYDLASLIDLLEAEPDAATPTISDFAARLLSSDVALVTYRTQLGHLARLRSSIWRREGGAWRLQFHQGTPAT